MTKKATTKKPNCYECKWRGESPGPAHSQCKHPEVLSAARPGDRAMAILASVGGIPPVLGIDAMEKLGIVGNLHGIRSGWFNWPYDFDPVWLETCNGFQKQEKRRRIA